MSLAVRFVMNVVPSRQSDCGLHGMHRHSCMVGSHMFYDKTAFPFVHVLLVSKADHCTTHFSQSVYQTRPWRVRILSLLQGTDCRDSTAASIVGHAHHLFKRPALPDVGPSACYTCALVYNLLVRCTDCRLGRITRLA